MRKDAATHGTHPPVYIRDGVRGLGPEKSRKVGGNFERGDDRLREI